MPLWFSIKTSILYRGTKTCVPINTIFKVPGDLRNIVDPVFERNGFFAHPEHLMLTMTQNNTKHIRELGLRRILKARHLDQK